MNPLQKNIALWLVISLVFVMVYHLFNQPKTTQTEIIYSEFLSYVDKTQVTEVTIQGDNISGKLTNGTIFKTYAPKDAGAITLLKERGVRITAKPVDDSPWYMTLLVSWLPMLLLIGVWIFFMRQMQGGGGKAMAFGKSRARLVTDKSKKVTFADVAGIEEAKAELQEVIDFLRDPKKYTKLGGRIPKGLLLVGQPGTGKTLLARAIAGEADVPFLSISGSDFVEMFVGVGASRVRDLFTQAKKNAPCIIFISATNRPDVLDPALLRPGRFDRQVVVPLPDVKGREKILEVHARKVPLAEDVDFAVIARGTPGFSGADIENLVNESVLYAARFDKEKVNMSDFEYAKDKVMMGAERKSMIISDAEKRNTAYHETGHALVARMLPGTDPIHKVTIIPRGRALGLTQQLPVDEKHTYPREYLLNNIVILLGGRAAEELILKDFTTGAGNDIERATNLARKMVCEWGMSDEMGPLSYGKKEEQIFLGREFATHKDYSEDTAKKIDKEVSRIVMKSYENAKQILSDRLDLLNRIAEELLEKEVLNGAELDAIIGIRRAQDDVNPLPDASA
ncbi:MAG: ATP-dependent metallopeptidase FtsH/Yme1/Tma family protein [Deltaproteobacteria bacterium]|nr:ATP-dependent metallopeptidase FtsH/Yme1/Tma family protein [Deltaproteobacteria bacterium]